MDCIDEALSSILGDGAVKSLYYAITTRFNFPGSEFPQRPLEVLEDLKKILGESGYIVLERAIRNQIEATFNVNESKDLNLLQIVELAKANYMQTSL